MFEIDPADFGAHRAAADKWHHTEEMRLKLPPAAIAALGRMSDGKSYWRNAKDAARDFIILMVLVVGEHDGDPEVTPYLRQLRHQIWVEEQRATAKFWSEYVSDMAELYQKGSLKQRKEYTDRCNEMMTWEDMPDQVRIELEGLIRRWS